MSRLDDELLKPLAELFPSGLTKEKLNLYRQRLSKLDINLLDETLDHVVDNYRGKTFPNISDIKDAYNKARRESFTETGTNYAPSALPKDLNFWQAADEFSKHKLAKVALERFVARSIVAKYMQGAKDFTMADIEEAQRAQRSAVTELKKQDRNHPSTSSLWSLYTTMQERNQQLVDKYLKEL